jgi:hypothetical protein
MHASYQYTFLECKCGHWQLFIYVLNRNSATADPQLVKEIPLRNCISAYPQAQFFPWPTTSNLQLLKLLGTDIFHYSATSNMHFLKKCGSVVTIGGWCPTRESAN